jgi:hypothetical protein
MEMTRTKLSALAVLLGAATLFAGCSGSDWEAVSYERGDTTVMRTVAGSAWGGPATLVERARITADPADTVDGLTSVTALTSGPNGDVYVVDGERPAVRLYDRDGRHVRAFVVPLGEPGHYSQPNGVAVLSDGRVVIRDPRRSQLVVYSPRGTYLERWPHQPGVYSPIPLISDAEDRLYTRIVFNPTEPREEWREGLMRYGSDGSIEDTIPDPEIDYVPPSMVVEVPGGDPVKFPIPLTPRAYWTRTPAGDVVTAISDRYALDVVKPDGSIVRIEREYEPVPASREERFTLYRDIDKRARQIDYRWTWRGPIIPEEKPPFKGLFADADGRIWIQLHQTAELTGEFAASAEASDTAASEAGSGAAAAPDTTADPDAAAVPEAEDPLPTVRDWREPIVFDVFEPDGRYLGQVSAPPGFRTQPLPSIRGNTVWAAVSDHGGVPDVVRFEIER